jgi:predicted acylesterase/phospholipase RssA
LVVAEADTEPGEVMFSVRSLLERTRCRAETNLILLHPAGSEIPHHTKTWLQGVDFKRHWHAHIGNKEDAQRIARFLDHRAVGLVLGGGLALGLAHIGVIEALRDLRIPIDYVGGTSMGAIVGISYALGYPQAKIAEILRDGCTASLKGDYTLPVVSLLSGKKLARSLSAYVREYDLEDLWLPYFAISASLVQAKMIVHKRGSALRSVLASSRFPGLFPPLGWDEDVLVDGGLVNNVPCDVMRAELGPGTVIGVDVSRGLDFSVTEQFDLHHSGWQMARRRINPFSTKPAGKNTTLASILQRIVRLGGVAHLHQVRSTADLYLIPPLHDFGFRDFHRGEEIAHVTHDYAIGLLESWMNVNGRPWDRGQVDR